MGKKVNLDQLARAATVPFTPVELADIDDYSAFVVMFEGTFPWHEHQHDEFFLLLDGELRVEFKGDLVSTTLLAMDSLLIKAGTIHQTVAPRRCRALVFEKRSVSLETLKHV